MNKELAVVVSNDNQNVTAKETIDAICNAGFKNVFVQWYDKDFEMSQLEQVNYCKQKGLNIIFAHLGYQKINEIWLPEGEYFVDRYKKDILDCFNLGIDFVVLHSCSKSEAPGPNELGLNRFKQIIKYAKEIGVKVAVENTKIKTHVEYLLDNLDDGNFGLCFDAGHYHAHFNDDWDLSKYKNRIYCVHLHDNHGNNEDEHLIPYDGTLDWKKTIDKLEECNYSGPITMELCYRNNYLSNDINEFYKKGYEAGIELSKLI